MSSSVFGVLRLSFAASLMWSVLSLSGFAQVASSDILVIVGFKDKNDRPVQGVREVRVDLYHFNDKTRTRGKYISSQKTHWVVTNPNAHPVRKVWGVVFPGFPKDSWYWIEVDDGSGNDVRRYCITGKGSLDKTLVVGGFPTNRQP